MSVPKPECLDECTRARLCGLVDQHCYEVMSAWVNDLPIPACPFCDTTVKNYHGIEGVIDFPRAPLGGPLN